jgi:hypothetical protein
MATCWAEESRVRRTSGQGQPTPRPAWVTGRETSPESFDYGEVVVAKVRVWNLPGGLGDGATVVGEIPHGTQVELLDHSWNSETNLHHKRVAAGGVRGWIPAGFVASRWSRITMLGTLKPAQSCTDLDSELTFRGMHLFLNQAGYAVVTEGSPSAFEAIRDGSSRLMQRVLASLAAATGQPLRAEPTNWVESPIGLDPRAGTVGFTFMDERPRDVSDVDIDKASTVVPLMATVPYLDLALNDYYLALDHPQHALIFLARAIESVENHFAKLAEGRERVGKEKLTRELLELTKKDVTYVTRRANASHRRHATRNGRAKPLPEEELTECFQRTAKVLIAFVDFLKSCGF